MRARTGANRWHTTEEGYANALIEMAVEQQITVLAITDHNSVSSMDAIRLKAHGRGITVFPGFELTSQEGIHVLCLYPPAKTEENSAIPW